MVTGQEVADFLGRGDEPELVATAERHLPIMVQFVRAYTRDHGFDASGDHGDDLAAVIVSATARQVDNPRALGQEAVGTVSSSFRFPHGWSLPELAVLHRHRRRAA